MLARKPSLDLDIFRGKYIDGDQLCLAGVTIPAAKARDEPQRDGLWEAERFLTLHSSAVACGKSQRNDRNAHLEQLNRAVRAPNECTGG